MPALRSVPKCRHRVCLRRPRPAASLRTLAGSNPSAWRRWLDLLDVRGSWLVWDGGIPRPPGRRPRPAASLRSLRAALENASRFLSSAPLRVRIPLRWAQKGKAPIAGSLSNQWWAMRDVRVRLRRPRPASGLRPSRAALENASRFLSSAPLRARIPPLAHKKAPWAVMGLGRSVLMAGTEGFEPPTAGTKNRSSTVELRPNVWCCPKATRLVYLICEGIANAVE